MTDPDKKPDPLTPETEHVPTRPASEVPDWIESMTGSGQAPEPARPPSVAADPFAGSTPRPPQPPATPTTPAQAPVTETFTVRPDGQGASAAPPDPTVRHQYAAPPPPQMSVQSTPGSVTSTDSKKIVAGILGILLGSLGVHKFYLGIQQPAIIMLCVTLGSWLLTVVTIGIASFITIPVITAMGIIGLVEGIIYLTKTDEQFRQEYEIGKKPWF